MELKNFCIANDGKVLLQVGMIRLRLLISTLLLYPDRVRTGVLTIVRMLFPSNGWYQELIRSGCCDVFN